jgi:alkyl sulfatase BDS1-like metallo-beta-lactamase superfamily hydrolase
VTGRKPATDRTLAANADPVDRTFDPADLERARRGFVAALDPPRIVDDKGRTVIDATRYDFLRDGRPRPDTVNPHLWRHAQLDAHHGLFQVAGSVWQVRGYDISNVTVTCAGKTVLSAEWGPAVSKNPYLQFKFQGGKKGDEITVTWLDNKNESRTDKATIN